MVVLFPLLAERQSAWPSGWPHHGLHIGLCGHHQRQTVPSSTTSLTYSGQMLCRNSLRWVNIEPVYGHNHLYHEEETTDCRPRLIPYASPSSPNTLQGLLHCPSKALLFHMNPFPRTQWHSFDGHLPIWEGPFTIVSRVNLDRHMWLMIIWNLTCLQYIRVKLEALQLNCHRHYAFNRYLRSIPLYINTCWLYQINVRKSNCML